MYRHTHRLHGKHLSSSSLNCIKGSQGTREFCVFGKLTLLEHEFYKTLGLNKEELKFS